MIEKERLEELIEQGATIYSTHWKEEVDLSQKCEVVKKSFYDGKERIVLIVHEDEEHSPHYMLENLTEDIEGAKWEEEFGCIERTERLELPTWEELFKEDRVLDCYTQEFGIVKNRSFIGVVLLGVDFTNEIVEVSIGSDQIFCELLTKENYTLACRKAKELFLGEKK